MPYALLYRVCSSSTMHAPMRSPPAAPDLTPPVALGNGPVPPSLRCSCNSFRAPQRPSRERQILPTIEFHDRILNFGMRGGSMVLLTARSSRQRWEPTGFVELGEKWRASWHRHWFVQRAAGLGVDVKSVVSSSGVVETTS